MGSVLAWEPASGVTLSALMLLVLALPWVRAKAFPGRGEGETPPAPVPGPAAAGARVDSRPTGVAVPRALHRDARFGP